MSSSAGIYVGFLAGVIGANSDKAEKLISDMFPMPPPDQVVVVKAIAYSGLPEWKELLGKFVERMPARRIVIEKYLYGKLPVLRDLPLDNPIAVDANWGYYFATGSSEPIQRLVRTLEWSKDKNNVERLTIGSMVKWTLAQNASRDPELLAYLKTSLPHQPELVEVPLKDIIEFLRDLRACAHPQGCARLHRGAEDQRLRERTRLRLVGTGGPDRVCARLRCGRRHGPGLCRHPLRRRRRAIERRAQVPRPRAVSPACLTADVRPSGTAAVIPLSSNSHEKLEPYACSPRNRSQGSR